MSVDDDRRGLGREQRGEVGGVGELGESERRDARLVRVGRRAARGVEEPRRARANGLERGGLDEGGVERAARRAQRGEIARVEEAHDPRGDLPGEVHEGDRVVRRRHHIHDARRKRRRPTRPRRDAHAAAPRDGGGAREDARGALAEARGARASVWVGGGRARRAFSTRRRTPSLLGGDENGSARKRRAVPRPAPPGTLRARGVRGRRPRRGRRIGRASSPPEQRRRLASESRSGRRTTRASSARRPRHRDPRTPATPRAIPWPSPASRATRSSATPSERRTTCVRRAGAPPSPSLSRRSARVPRPHRAADRASPPPPPRRARSSSATSSPPSAGSCPR